MKGLMKMSFLLFFFSQSFALTIRVTGSDTVSFPIAQIGVTRISVANDRIVQVIGNYQGSNQNDIYSVHADKDTGNIFISPEQEHPFTIMIKTESGHYYTLKLKPSPSMSEAVLLQTGITNTPSMDARIKPLNYMSAITTLIKAMVNNHVPDQYASLNINDKPKRVNPSLQIRLVKVWQGLSFTGEIFQIKNVGKTALHLSERQFKNMRVVAVGLSSLELAPKRAAWCYEVLKNG